MITSHTSISNIHTQNATLFKEYFLPSTLKPFQRMRRDIDLAIQEISEALGGPPAEILQTTEGGNGIEDLEKAAVPTAAGQGTNKLLKHINGPSARFIDGTDTPAAVQDEEEQDEIRERLRRVAGRLALEVANEGLSPVPTVNRSLTATLASSSATSPKAKATLSDESGSKLPPMDPHKCTCGPSSLLADFESFRKTQQELLGAALACGRLHGGSNKLRLYEERKCLAEEEGRDWVRGDAEIRKRGRGHGREASKSRATSRTASVRAGVESMPPISAMDLDVEEAGQDTEEDARVSREDQMMYDTRQCMVRVYSLLYALG